MGLFIMEITTIINLKAEENLPMVKDKYTKANGKTELNRVKAFGRESKDKIIWVNGKMANPKVTVFL